MDPVTWDTRHAETVPSDLRARDAIEIRKQVYVFAGNWEPEFIDRLILDDEEDWFRPPMARELRGMGGLWIVAAGQDQDAKKRPLRVERRLRYGPMNLGDQGNVLVVTGCENCGKDSTICEIEDLIVTRLGSPVPNVVCR